MGECEDSPNRLSNILQDLDSLDNEILDLKRELEYSDDEMEYDSFFIPTGSPKKAYDSDSLFDGIPLSPKHITKEKYIPIHKRIFESKHKREQKAQEIRRQIDAAESSDLTFSPKLYSTANWTPRSEHRYVQPPPPIETPLSRYRNPKSDEIIRNSRNIPSPRKETPSFILSESRKLSKDELMESLARLGRPKPTKESTEKQKLTPKAIKRRDMRLFNSATKPKMEQREEAEAKGRRDSRVAKEASGRLYDESIEHADRIKRRELERSRYEAEMELRGCTFHPNIAASLESYKRVSRRSPKERPKKKEDSYGYAKIFASRTPEAKAKRKPRKMDEAIDSVIAEVEEELSHSFC